MWLFSRWIVRALAAPEFFDSYEAIGLIATAVTLYALYMVLVVILGRTGRTEFNFPATIAALVVNVALNLVLVPPLGIVGAGLALVASYVVVVALMYVFTQRLFPVPYEWGRLARVRPGHRRVVLAGELLVPTEGAVGFALRLALWLLYPLAALRSAASSPPRSAAGWRWRPAIPARSCAGCERRPAAAGRRRLGPRGLRGRADGRGRPPAELRPVADALAAAGEQRLAGVGPVDAGRWPGRTAAASARSA